MCPGEFITFAVEGMEATEGSERKTKTRKLYVGEVDLEWGAEQDEEWKSGIKG